MRTAGVESPNAIAGLTPGKYVSLTVCDTGTGITPEVRARLFEPFFTTKGERGTGFGLATVYSVVKRFGGEVSVATAPGAGSTFEVMLPAVERAPRGRAARPGSHAGPEALRVLLAEDEEALRRLITRVLESTGHEVRSAPSGKAALEEWRNRGAIDLLITDMVMPDISGVELAEQIAREQPDVRVLYISGYTDAVLDTALPNGQTPEFLQKPFTARQLTDAVARLFA